VSGAALDQDDDRQLSSLPVGRHHSLSRSPQSPVTDAGVRDLTRELSGGVSTTGRKTVRFADEPSPTDRDRASPSDVERPSTDVGYTIRPHYPTRVTLSTFHSSPTITSEL